MKLCCPQRACWNTQRSACSLCRGSGRTNVWNVGLWSVGFGLWPLGFGDLGLSSWVLSLGNTDRCDFRRVLDSVCTRLRSRGAFLRGGRGPFFIDHAWCAGILPTGRQRYVCALEDHSALRAECDHLAAEVMYLDAVDRTFGAGGEHHPAISDSACQQLRVR